VPDDADIEQPFASYDAVLSDTADNLAPMHTARWSIPIRAKKVSILFDSAM